MAGFKQLSGLVVPLDAANVDTDAIIPKQFLQAITRVGFGKHLFHEWRYLDVEGTKPNPDFVLNYPQYQGATILLARKNLGCGSSREHAPIAIKAAGISVVIASSFARIFYRNAINVGLAVLEIGDAVDEIHGDDILSVDLSTGKIQDLTAKKEFTAQPLPGFIQDIAAAGGLINYVKEKA